MIFLVLADPTHTNYSRWRVTGGGIQCEVLSAHPTGAVVRAMGDMRGRTLDVWFNKDPSPWIKFRSADSSSTNAVNFSSARTTKRFPSLRCPSATKIIRPRKSTADIEPQLQPALLRLPAISQYFTHGYPRTLSSIAALALFVFSRRLFRGERHLNSFANQERNATQDLGRSNIYVRTVR